MGLKVDKKVIHNGQEFDGYEIIGIEWIFKDNSFCVLVDYFFNRYTKNIRRVHKHYFEVGNDVNVDELINKVHELHNG